VNRRGIVWGAKAEPPVFALSGGFAVRCMRAAIDVPNNSGSLAIFAAIPRASSLVSGLAVAWRAWPLQMQRNFVRGLKALSARLTHCGMMPTPDDPHHAQRVCEICLYRRSRCRFSRMPVNSFAARGASGPRGRSVDLAPGVINRLRGFASTTLTPARPRLRVSPPRSA